MPQERLANPAGYTNGKPWRTNILIREHQHRLKIFVIFSHDHSKIKELALLIEHMTDEVHKKKKCLDHETTETLTAQVRL